MLTADHPEGSCLRSWSSTSLGNPGISTGVHNRTFMCAARRVGRSGSEGRSPKSLRKLVAVRSAQLLNPRSRTISVFWLAWNGLGRHGYQEHLGKRVNSFLL